MADRSIKKEQTFMKKLRTAIPRTELAPATGTKSPDVEILGKPVIMQTCRVLNLDSGFRHKYLCSGPTFTAGTACAYNCSYCFVESQVGTKPFVSNVLGQSDFRDVVIRRCDPVGTLKRELYDARGKPKYKSAKGEIYGLPLVDIAAHHELIEETNEIVQLILGATGWDIRLLSKSSAIVKIAKSLAPEQKKRVTFGLSTGTLNDDYARAIRANLSAANQAHRGPALAPGPWLSHFWHAVSNPAAADGRFYREGADRYKARQMRACVGRGHQCQG